MARQDTFGPKLFTGLIVGGFLVWLVGSITADVWKGIEAQNLSNN